MRKNLSTADKREREKQVVDLMIALYCRKKHQTALPGMSGASFLLAPSLGPLSVHGIKNLLQQLPRALLPPGNAGTDPGSHAVFRSKDAAAPSRYGSGSHDLLDERKEKTKRRTMI